MAVGESLDVVVRRAVTLVTALRAFCREDDECEEIDQLVAKLDRAVSSKDRLTAGELDDLRRSIQASFDRIDEIIKLISLRHLPGH